MSFKIREVSKLSFGPADPLLCKKVKRKWWQLWKPRFRWVSDAWDTKPVNTKTWTDEK